MKIQSDMKLNFLSLIISLLCVGSQSCKETEETIVSTPVVTKPPSDTVSTTSSYGVILRTPEARFKDLKDYNFQENYVFLEGTDKLRMHYIDEGKNNKKVILLLHGNPAWVYNFRKLVPQLVAKGYRVIAPDLIGFGKSDKPASRSSITYENQVTWVETFVKKMNISDINLHVQDWGGLIGLRVAVKNKSLFSKIAISNTALMDGTNVTAYFRAWRSGSQTVATVSSVMEQATFRELSIEEEAAYDAPFPEERFKAAPREMPLRVPISATDPEGIKNADYNKELAEWNIPIVTIFSEVDDIFKGEELKIHKFKGAIGQPHTIVKEASHFIREDQPQIIADLLSSFYK
ncbi:MAG: haloalkane dehalogenase [Leadbetterella sp.]